MTASVPATTSQQEKFCLRWNDFESNLSGAFRELRQESEYLDVTLLCEDEDQIEAHRSELRWRFLVVRITCDVPSPGWSSPLARDSSETP